MQKRLEVRRPDLDSALEESRQLSADTGPAADTEGGPESLQERAEGLQRRWAETEGRCQTLADQLRTEVQVRRTRHSAGCGRVALLRAR